MKHLAAAVFAACIAMLVTSGLVAFATAAPEPAPAPIEVESVREVETALLAQLDTRIEAQLAQVRTRLGR
jgi:hypothetical protein